MIWDNDPTSPSFGLITDQQSPHFGLPVDQVFPQMVEGPSGAPVAPDVLNSRMLGPNEIPSATATSPSYADLLQHAVNIVTQPPSAPMDVPYPIGGAIEEPPIGQRAYDEVRRLVHQAVTGEPSLPQPVGTAQRVENSIMEFPGDVAGFLTTPEGVATTAMWEFGGPIARLASTLGFTADQIKNFIQAGTLEDRVKAALGAGLSIAGVKHEVAKQFTTPVDQFFRNPPEEKSNTAETAAEVVKHNAKDAIFAGGQEQAQQQENGVPPTLNIGSNIGDQRAALKVEQVLNTLKGLGVNLSRKPYLKAGGEEPFYIVNPEQALTNDQGIELAKQLGQQAIPQYAGGKGQMFVPEPSKLANPDWGNFNSDYFTGLDKNGNPVPLNQLVKEHQSMLADEALKRALQPSQQQDQPNEHPDHEAHTTPLQAPIPQGLTDAQESRLTALHDQASELQNDLTNFVGKPDTAETRQAQGDVQDKLWSTFDQIHKLREASGQPRDFVVIGGGAGGLKAAAHAAYEGLDTLVLDKDTTVGGQAKRSQEIINTGARTQGITGRDYFRDKEITARNRGAQIRTGVEVKDIRQRPDGGVDIVTKTGEVIPARRALIATGASPNIHPGFELAGYGNAERLARKAKGKEAVVYGGGNSATQAVIGAVRRGAKKVYIISRHDLAREASADQVERLQAFQREGKVGILTDEITGIKKTDNGYTVSLKSGKSLPVAHVETFLDSNLNTGWLPKGIEKVALPSRPGRPAKPGPVKVLDASLKTTMPGVYVAGDIRASLPGEDRPRRIDMAEGDAAGVAARAVKDIYSFRKTGNLPAWTANEVRPQATTTVGGMTNGSRLPKNEPTSSASEPQSRPETSQRPANGGSKTSSVTSSEPGVWTQAKAAPIADAIGGRVVGSVAKKGLSAHDLDISVDNYDHAKVADALASRGFEWNGSNLVSPKEAQASGKPYGSGWQREEFYENPDGRKIGVWHEVTEANDTEAAHQFKVNYQPKRTVGINNKAISEQAEAGRYGAHPIDQEPGKGTSVADLRQAGQEAARNGEDYNEAVGRLQSAGHDVARLRTEYERLAYNTDKAQAAWNANKTPETRAAYDAAQKAETDFYNRTIKAVKAPVSDALRAFQGKAEPDATTYEGLTRIARASTGKPLTPRQEARIQRSFRNVETRTQQQAKALKSLSMALQKTPIRSNRRLRTTSEMRDMLQELKDKLTPCQK